MRPRLATLGLQGARDWRNNAGEGLPETVEVRGAARPLVWRLDRGAGRCDSTQVQFVYVADSPRLRLIWRWRARARFGPLEHTLSIDNLSADTVWLPLQPSFSFDWQVDHRFALQRFWVEKGADTPSDVGTHLDPLRDGDVWQGTSSTYARPIAGQPREMIPYLLVDRPVCGAAGLVRRHRVQRTHPDHAAA